MIRTALAAATLFAAVSLSAQSTTQEKLEERHDRALAAGYKALFLCSAIANAERNGATRTPESVEQWELSSIQEPLDGLIATLPYEIERDGDGEIATVSVEWAEHSLPRMAVHDSGKGCSQLPVNGVRLPFMTKRPAPEFERVSLVSLEPKIAPVFGRAFKEVYGEGTRTTAVLAMRNGDLIGEEYASDFGPVVPQRTWSVAKSIAATLVGAAVQAGETDVEKSAGIGLFPSDRRTLITIDDLLRMASGRYSDTAGNRTDPLYFGGATVQETALHWPLLHQPGSVYRYANNDTLAAVKAIEGYLERQSPAQILARLGMDHTVAETDWQGDYVLSSQVWSTARDLAKLGQLYLDEGVLPSGERILPENWVDYVSSPTGPQPDGPFGYGAGFWLFNNSDGVPSDTFAAMGNRGQFIVIVPSMNVVIVRRGEDPVGSRFDITSFTLDLLDSIKN